MSSLSSVKFKDSVGKVHRRIPKQIPFGTFEQITVRFKGFEYVVGDGNEHLDGGYGKVFELGKNLGPYKG